MILAAMRCKQYEKNELYQDDLIVKLDHPIFISHADASGTVAETSGKPLGTVAGTEEYAEIS